MHAGSQIPLFYEVEEHWVSYGLSLKRLSLRVYICYSFII
jgi:hypothetical protein